MEGPVTARPLYKRQEEGTQNGSTPQKKDKKKKRAGRWMSSFFKKASACCSRSYSTDASPKSEETPEPEEHRLSRKTIQDHDRDNITAYLIAKVGRYDYASYQNVHRGIERLVARDTGLTLRDRDEISRAGRNELNCSKERMYGFWPPSSRTEEKKPLDQSQADRTSVLSVPCSPMQCRPARHYDCQTFGKHPDVHAGLGNGTVQVKKREILSQGNHMSVNCGGSYEQTGSSVKAQGVHCGKKLQDKAGASLEPAPSDLDTHGSLVDDLKECLHQISAEISGNLTPQNNKHSMRGNAREKLFSPISLKRASLRHLFGFSHFERKPVELKAGMLNGNEYCHPRYADFQARRNTLKDCTDPQLNGYEFEELARVGWYFNRRALVTFCCGMEMPMTPNGHPLDVHLGLSPHCGFARSLKTPPVGSETAGGATGPEKQSTEGDDDDLEASGGVSELRFSVPVQATDDASAGYGISSTAYDAAGFDFDGVLQRALQESGPGEYYSIDRDMYALPGATAVLGGSAYTDSLVTSTTPLPTERFEPFSNNPHPAQQRLAGTMQNGVGTTGRLFMRGIVQDPMGSARLLRDLEGDGRRSPPDFSPADQINMDGHRADYRARYPQFGFPTVRNWTFEGWPRTHKQTPSMLADAGFFYAGYGDSVLCYSCGIGVRHWLPMDDPWIEHARWRPSCAYVQTMQGQEFIDAAVELTLNNRHPTYQEVRLAANRRRRAAEAGNEEVAPTPAVPGEDETGLLCKVCYEEQMNTVLMPCRHLAVCESCSGRVGTCPICRTPIESTFRANFD